MSEFIIVKSVKKYVEIILTELINRRRETIC